MYENVGWMRGLSVGIRALLVGWHVQWREWQYDRARERYRKAARRANAFMDRHDDVFTEANGWARRREE